MDEARVARSEPILPCRNLDETRRFYRNLGFEPWWNGEAPAAYEIVSRGDVVLHFYLKEDLVPAANESMCYWRVADADALHAELSGAGLPHEGVPRLTAPGDRPWGMREFALVDPSGNLCRIGQPLGSRRTGGE